MPKKGTREHDIMLYFLQVAEGSISAFATRAGVNAIVKDSIMKELLTWVMGIILSMASIFFSKSPASNHLKAMAFGVIMEALNRSIMKRIEKTEMGMKYLSGDDEIILSEEEMNKLLETREEEVLNGLDENGNPLPELDEDGNPLEGDDDELDEDGNPLEGDDQIVVDHITPMII